MIAEFQLRSPLLRSAVREASIGEIPVEGLDRARQGSLRAVCWLEGGDTETFEAALAADRTVAKSTRVIETARGKQYTVRCGERSPERKLYTAAIEEEGVFVSGTRNADHWSVRLRFPDDDAAAAFRDRIERTDVVVESVQQAAESRAPDYGVSDPQLEILQLATRRGYFDVPRRASLADLAAELDVSSQAASERLRRGLDSLVDRTLSPSS